MTAKTARLTILRGTQRISLEVEGKLLQGGHSDLGGNIEPHAR